MPSPIWPLQEDHLNEFLEAAQDIGTCLPQQREPILPEVLPEWGPEQRLLFKLWVRTLQDVSNVSLRSTFEAKRNAADALWWVFAFPQSVAKLGLLKNEHNCRTIVIPKRMPVTLSVWAGLDVTPDEFFCTVRKDPPEAPYFTFTECCANLDVEVPLCREFFLRTVAGNAK